jgi:ubiquinone/menaquinone biosynthesis C-methylase UbiE
VNAAGLRGQVQIEYGDAAALVYPDESFDAVLAFESLPHAHDRGQWLREMVRVLRRGGRIVLTEFTKEVPLTEKDVEVLRANGLEPPLLVEEVAEIVRDSGLAVDEIDDCGDRIRRSYPAYFDRLARRRSELVAAFGEERVNKQEQEMLLLLAVYRDKIGYLILTGHQPG